MSSSKSRRRWTTRPVRRRALVVALIVGVVSPTISAASAHASPAAVAAADPSDGVDLEHAAAARRAALGDASDRLGSSGATFGAFTGVRHVVLARDEAALDRLLTLPAIEPITVWRDAVFGFTAVLSPDEADELRSAPDVIGVERDRVIRASATQPTPPWGLDRIDQSALPVDDTYTYGATGRGVTAYVIDSGLWLSHAEFAGRVEPGAYYDYGDGTGVWDCAGHGTHVAGTLGGSTYGVAKRITIVPVKVLDCDGAGTLDAIVGGIDWVAQQHRAGDPAVANLSLGGLAIPVSVIVEEAVEGLIADGVTVVAAAGNDAAPSCDYTPARVPAAITVAASTPDDDDADFSNYGPCNDLFAPGVQILSAYPGLDNVSTRSLSGTSMAAPHVAGAAALFLQGSPAATPAQVWAAIDAAASKDTITGFTGDPTTLLNVASFTAAQTAPFTPLVPGRVLDTRPGEQTSDRQFEGIGRRTAGSTTALHVAGRAGVPANAEAVMLNLTAVNPSSGGFLTIYPCGGVQPLASSLNYAPGQVVANAVLAKVGAGGDICIFTLADSDVLVDVNGYVPAGGTPVPLAPARALDTRPGESTTDMQFAGIGRRPAGSETAVTVAGRLGVPSNATAVMLNVTAVAPSGGGFLTLYPCGEERPLASNVNYSPGQVVPNAVLAKVGAGGSVCVFTLAETDIIIDVNGYATGTGTPVPVFPVRVYETRVGEQTFDGQAEGVGRRGAAGVSQVIVGGRAAPIDATAVLLNVTAINPSSGGFLTVYPCNEERPLASNVNFSAGQVVPNAVLAKLGDARDVCIFNLSETDFVVDVTGYVDDGA